MRKSTENQGKAIQRAISVCQTVLCQNFSLYLFDDARWRSHQVIGERLIPTVDDRYGSKVGETPSSARPSVWPFLAGLHNLELLSISQLFPRYAYCFLQLPASSSSQAPEELTILTSETLVKETPIDADNCYDSNIDDNIKHY